MCEGETGAYIGPWLRYAGEGGEAGRGRRNMHVGRDDFSLSYGQGDHCKEHTSSGSGAEKYHYSRVFAFSARNRSRNLTLKLIAFYGTLPVHIFFIPISVADPTKHP